MTELQHNRQIILWVSVHHSVWKTPKQSQSQVPKPVARDGASSVATCWAAAIINACAGLWMEHRRNQRNAKCKKNDSKADPILGFKFWTPKWEPGKKKWKPDPILGSKIWTPKWGQPPGSICRHLLSEFHRPLMRERFKTCFQPARSPTQTEEAPSGATSFGTWNWPCFVVWEKG